MNNTIDPDDHRNPFVPNVISIGSEILNNTISEDVKDLALGYIKDLAEALELSLAATSAKATYKGNNSWSTTFLCEMHSSEAPLEFREYSEILAAATRYTSGLDTLHHLKFSEVVYPSTATSYPVCFYTLVLCIKTRNIKGQLIDLNIRLTLSYKPKGH